MKRIYVTWSADTYRYLIKKLLRSGPRYFSTICPTFNQIINTTPTESGGLYILLELNYG